MTMEEWNQKQQEEKKVEHIRPEDVTVEPAPAKNQTVNTNPKNVVTESDPGLIPLILGIISIVIGLIFGGIAWVGILTGIGAIIVSNVEKKKYGKSTMLTAALICGIVGVSVSLLMWLFLIGLKLSIGLLSGFLGLLFS